MEVCAWKRTVSSSAAGQLRGAENRSEAVQEDGRWLRFDDANVVAVPLSRVLDEKAYLLFYQLRA